MKISAFFYSVVLGTIVIPSTFAAASPLHNEVAEKFGAPVKCIYSGMPTEFSTEYYWIAWELEADPTEDSLFSKFHLHRGDLITGVNGRLVSSRESLFTALTCAKNTGSITLTMRDSRRVFFNRTRKIF